MIVQTFEELITRFRAATPPTPANPTEDDLAPWRDRIDALDRALLQLLNQRAVCANQIGQLKKKLGMPVYAPQREVDVLENVKHANEGPLSNEAVVRLFERVIDETRSLERHIFEEEKRGERERGNS